MTTALNQQKTTLTLFKHENCSDVAVEILQRVEGKNGLISLEVAWWNLGAEGKPFPLGFVETIHYPKSRMKEWQELTFDLKDLKL